MENEEEYVLHLKKYAKKVKRDYDDIISYQNHANLFDNQHKMLLEGLMKNFDFSLIKDDDLEKVELYDFWKGENGRASKKR